MKQNPLPASKAFFLRFRLPIILTLMVVLLALGGAYGWRYYQYYTGPEHALLKLNNALRDANQEQLNKLVDLRTLSWDFAEAVLKVYPPEIATHETITKTANAVQMAVLKAVAEAKEDKPSKEPADDAPLAPLPSNFMQQLAGKLTLQSALDNVALLQYTVSYPRAERDFPLLLQMNNTAEFGWRVTKVINAMELAQTFKAAEASLKLQQEVAFAEKNAEQQLRMDAQFPISSCTVGAGRLSDNQTALMVIQIMGRNAGPSSFHNANFVVTVTDAAQTTLYTHHLNVAQRSLPGEQFSHRWTVELDPSDASAARLLAAKQLQCSARLRALALGSGEVLHIREKQP